ncbi:DDT domain-containing protein DDR4 [Phoenix dactylifera]|uniref:DDT domain-containing protein DDR4 n=1 Tax=Phoenix dactylifera TaxID=42345 RepID=A0A8B7C7K7_PHODC|nr:DDT domain-containing protein DDR4 [Phoenix dactylifera]
MAEKRGRGRAAGRTISEPEVVILDGSSSDPSISASQFARLRLRQRWELASVLNFLHVFEPLIQSDVKMSAEEIETALISPNDALARIHIALLKGIPPVNKNCREPDAWVTTVCKKLSLWWPWVAEGENPLKVNHGEEITKYKELDPTIRLLILKALCEVRADQDDILRYITDELKAGTKITAFRKEKICSSENGVSYWYDGDPIIGHRLYREVVKVDFKQKWKGKGRLTQPTIDSCWETVATNLEEFRELSKNLSSSKVTSEAAVGETIKIEIIPLLEEHQKKKKRALQRQQRQVTLLDNLLHSNWTGSRSCRERRPVSYTFDEYDRSIDEAIQMSKKSNTDKLHEDRGKGVEHVPGQNRVLDGTVHADTENTTSDSQAGDDDKYRGKIGGDDAEDDDYDQKGNDYAENSGSNDSNFDLGDSDKENTAFPRKKWRGHAQNKKEAKPKVVIGVRHSRRTAASADHGHLGRFHGEMTGHVEMKKRVRQRPTRNADYAVHIFSESENEKQAEEVSGTEKEPVSSGDEFQAGNDEIDDE